MDIKDVKLGMTVKIVKDPGRSFYGHKQVGDTLTVLQTPPNDDRETFKAEGFKSADNTETTGWIDAECCEPIDLTVFTRDMLKTGMRVVYRDGVSRVVVGKTLRYNTGSSGIEDFTITFSNNLAHVMYADLDIMEVYAAPASCEDLFDLDIRGELLFKREEKTEKQKQAEELMKKADKLKAEFEALVKQATDLAGA